MLNSLFDLGRKALLNLDPEKAHEITVASFERGLYPRDATPETEALRCKLGDLQLANPIGVAAGFDKDARAPDAVLGIGCGFAEIGTVTPHPQDGNPTPRLFRLVEDRAVINRFGFNSGGHAAALTRLRDRARRGGVVGVNIGANKTASDRTADYVAGIETFYDVASYFTVNISSPNTPGLRDLQAPAALDELLGRVMAARAQRISGGAVSRPIVVKVAPDIAEDDIAAIVDRLMAHKVDLIAVSNTTLSRPATLADVVTARETGGLSGRPLFHKSTAMLARFHQATQGRVPLIGIGGIDSGATALAKIEAGASLIQLYTGLVFEGVELIGQIKRHLAEHCRVAGVKSIGELVGSKATEWARRPLDP